MPDAVYDVAFVTVNYNTCELVRDMLLFFSQAKLPFSHKLVVVDNGSSDGSHELLTNSHNGVVYIPAGENLGYGRAINRGIRAIRSRYICVLNTDISMTVESLTRLWDFMEATPGAGVVAPRICNRDGSTQGFIFQQSHFSELSPFINRIRTSMIKKALRHTTKPMRVHGVLGAFFIVRRDLAKDGALFDEDFFFYFEDTELAHRLHAAGVACYVLPDCSIIHYGGASTSIEGARMFFRSKNLYLRKCYGPGFAAFIKVLDRARLRAKFFKYWLLALAVPAKRIAGKKNYYYAMRKASDF